MLHPVQKSDLSKRFVKNNSLEMFSWIFKKINLFKDFSELTNSSPWRERGEKLEIPVQARRFHLKGHSDELQDRCKNIFEYFN